MDNTSTPLHGAALRWFAIALVVATLVLIFLGGQVKSHEAGLAVPDWPWTFGENPITYAYDKWVGGIFHEHLHRLVAGVVATLTIVLAVWLGLRGKREGLMELGIVAVVAVLSQAVLGGMTVLLQLPAWTSTAHATLAQTFLVIVTIVAYRLSRERDRRDASLEAGDGERATPLKAGVLVLIAVLYGQLLLGAVMRHTESALAIPDFPTTAGNVIPQFNDETLAWVNDWRLDHSFNSERGVDLPPVTMGQVAIHFAHRVGALVVTAVVVALSVTAYRRRAAHPLLWRSALWMLGLLVLQVTLGATTVWTARVPLIASLHVVTGAAMLCVATVWALRAWPVRAVEEECDESIHVGTDTRAASV